MKKLLLLSTLWVATVLLHAQGIAFEPAGTTMEQAMVKAKKEGKMIFVDCYTTWCGPCKAIAPIVDELAVEYDGKALVCKCNVDECDDVPMNYNIRSIPTLLFFKNGELVDRHVGVISKADLAAKIEALR